MEVTWGVGGGWIELLGDDNDDGDYDDDDDEDDGLRYEEKEDYYLHL